MQTLLDAIDERREDIDEVAVVAGLDFLGDVGDFNGWFKRLNWVDVGDANGVLNGELNDVVGAEVMKYELISFCWVQLDKSGWHDEDEDTVLDIEQLSDEYSVDIVGNWSKSSTFLFSWKEANPLSSFWVLLTGTNSSSYLSKAEVSIGNSVMVLLLLKLNFHKSLSFGMY